MSDEKRTRKLWLYAPGAGASQWELYKEQGVAGIGYNDLGLKDLSQYESEEDAVDARVTSGKEWSAKMLYRFYSRLQIGDILLAKQGRSKLVGWGEVTGEYEYQPGRFETSAHEHFRAVRWHEHEIEWPSLLAMESFLEKTHKAKFKQTLANKLGLASTANLMDELLGYFESQPDDVESVMIPTPGNLMKTAEVVKYPRAARNIVLYGPPGTGKTFGIRDTIASILHEFDDPLAERDDLITSLMQEKRIAYVTFHQSYTYEDLIEGLRPSVQDGVIQYNIEDGIFKQLALDAWRSYLWQEQTEEGVTPETRDDARTAPQYFLVIDELNRGNVSKIFGELITLLEPSKRLGMEEQMIVTLPLSKEPFGVPANLHVIATMNTADRSIATLDVALRRRFRFEERMPDVGILEKTLAESDVKKKVIALFEVLNRRIEFLVDRDHTLGHAIFMGVESYSSLREVMRYNVIPLLQEYFYGEWDKIALVLGHDVDAPFGILKQQRLDRDLLFPVAKDVVLEAARDRYEIDDAFLTAREEELAPYFDQVLGTGVGSP